MLRDFTINTNYFVPANQPDIVIFDTSSRILDVAMFLQIFNIVLKEQEKISKYVSRFKV